MKMKIRSCSSLQYVSVCLSVFLSVYPSMAASLAAQYVGAAMKIIITTHYQQLYKHEYQDEYLLHQL